MFYLGEKESFVVISKMVGCVECWAAYCAVQEVFLWCADQETALKVAELLNKWKVLVTVKE